jgi:hypothetical protein
VNTILLRILLLGAALAFLIPAVRPEQPQKPSRPTPEDRIKKLEERTDAVEKAATSAAMEKDYITRSQRLYESYYQKVLNTQMWILGIVGLILISVFVLFIRFSMNMIDERTKTTIAQATVQMRNEYARALAKEVQKLWESNAGDIKKLKESLTAQVAELEQNARDKSDFQIRFVQALAECVDAPRGDSVLTFRDALSTYKLGKPRNLIESKVGATTGRHVFEALRKKHGENYMDKSREELADPLYNGLEEELALAALQIPWLTPLINERSPVVPQPPPTEPVSESRPAALPGPNVLPTEMDTAFGEESDSCRLINT